ncbi:MAG: ATP-dependent Clp protease adaptor ClpS [Chlorobi bacterium]|nr:ATP-dependent Clp protease adaptor ClpS [Chlorobiota bacterium]
MVKEIEKPVGKVSTNQEELKKLILFNDDVNTFEFVIDSLIEVCEHNPMQAENCAMITHFKGRCPVMSGSFKDLEPYHKALSKRQLTVEIS